MRKKIVEINVISQQRLEKRVPRRAVLGMDSRPHNLSVCPGLLLFPRR